MPCMESSAAVRTGFAVPLAEHGWKYNTSTEKKQASFSVEKPEFRRKFEGEKQKKFGINAIRLLTREWFDDMMRSIHPKGGAGNDQERCAEPVWIHVVSNVDLPGMFCDWGAWQLSCEPPVGATPLRSADPHIHARELSRKLPVFLTGNGAERRKNPGRKAGCGGIRKNGSQG